MLPIVGNESRSGWEEEMLAMKSVDTKKRPTIESTTRTKEFVILVHGLASHQLFLKWIGRHLRRVGYATRYWSYPSIFHSIDYHGSKFADEVRRYQVAEEIERIHFVTHSMGGIVTRCALNRLDREKLGRWVMLAPPNRGSHVARKLAPTLGRVCKTLTELSDSEDSFVNSLGDPTDIELGIITAARDRVVRREYTHLETAKSNLVVPAGHTTMLFRNQVLKAIESFLKSGDFTSERV